MEDVLLLYVMLFGIGIALASFLGVRVLGAGKRLNDKVRSLGTLAGKSLTEIEAAVGPAQAVSAAPEGKTVRQWMATGYHIALLFDDDVCEGVTHEVRV